MDLGATIYAHLAANVGSISVRSDSIPKTNASLPTITYRIIDTTVHQHLAGVADMFTARVEVASHSETRSEANSNAELVRQIMQSIPLHDTSQGAYIHDVNVATGQHYLFTPDSETTDRRFITAQDYFVSYRPDVLATL